MKNDILPQQLLDMFRRMALIRRYEDHLYRLFLQGQVPGTLHQCQGQEATAVGVTTAVAVGTVVVGDGDAEGPLALRCCVQPARATSAATTAQHPARYRTMPAVALPARPGPTDDAYPR